ncbi:hypothetical protein AX769_05070 [Frondihabitans sp. PAMC 28766]|uniref:GH25 family lysozyme n=1 Tax=Frondihabitans sp. PAMC 28766 TaxID=1795630 RepID=UPI00078DC9F0|nr:GH25 family lysozyme [Frondihabitans sp. PAMC 28766]AMM19626.1 hypothetical protein AX769_05070 [Frondihabitans sp. PAMC 28766]
MRSRSTLVAALVVLVLLAGAGVADAKVLPRRTAPVAVASPAVRTPGLDVSAYQHGVDWETATGAGARFAYVKATEGSNYTNARLAEQYTGAAAAGLSRGAFHFARPNQSNGVVQAEYFAASLKKLGGGRVDGTRTLPPLLDLESDPYTGSDHTNLCWGLTPAEMVTWIAQFSDTVIALTDRTPVIYTTTHWWQVCTGDSLAFGNYPLFVASYVSDFSKGAGSLPAAWPHWTFWQYTNAGTQYAGVADRSKGSIPARDQDIFRGSLADVQALARSTFARSSGLDPALAPVPSGGR